MKVETAFGTDIYIFDENDKLEDLPKEGFYYVLAANGLFVHKDTGTIQAMVPVENCSVLQDLDTKQFACHNLPLIPAKIVSQIKAFFAKIVEKYHSEACTVLYFNEATNEYKVVVPSQRASHGHVRYKLQNLDMLPGMEGFVPVGTLHSHCDFNAFHSGTDDADEDGWDGVHITFGHNDLDDFSISASIVLNGTRMMLDPATILAGLIARPDGMFSLTSPEVESEEELQRWIAQVNGGQPSSEKLIGDIFDEANMLFSGLFGPKNFTRPGIFGTDKESK